MSDTDGQEPINPDIQPSDDTDWLLGRAPDAGEDHVEELANSPADGQHTRRSVGSRAVAVVALVAVGTAAGVGIGHAVWQPDSSHQSATLPSNGSGPGSGPGSGGYGEIPGFPGGNLPGLGDGGSLPIPGTGGSANSNTSDGPTDAAAIARDVNPGVVDITTTVAGGEAAGTGMVLTSDGEVLTNNHVIDGATSISVRDVGNGNTYKATVVGYDRTGDVAVLQLAGASGLTTVTTATSEPSVGAAVVGIGNAGGLGGTPSYAGGAITATDTAITATDQFDGSSQHLTGLLATDADIQSGDSGGPLVNTSGQVVGMDTAASAGYRFTPYDDNTSDTAHGFAIPILTALQIAGEIRSGDSSSTVHVGPTAKLGVYVNARTSADNGAQVVRVETGGPAANAGLTQGDVIESVDGTSIGDSNDLTTLMTQFSPGQTVSVTYTTADGANQTTRVTLGTGAPQ